MRPLQQTLLHVSAQGLTKRHHQGSAVTSPTSDQALERPLKMSGPCLQELTMAPRYAAKLKRGPGMACATASPARNCSWVTQVSGDSTRTQFVDGVLKVLFPAEV
jgi:hypothetical protein